MLPSSTQSGRHCGHSRRVFLRRHDATGALNALVAKRLRLGSRKGTALGQIQGRIRGTAECHTGPFHSDGRPVMIPAFHGRLGSSPHGGGEGGRCTMRLTVGNAPFLDLAHGPGIAAMELA